LQTMKLSVVLLIALGLFAGFTCGQFLSAKSSQFQVQVNEHLPWFYFSTLDGNSVVQNISVNFLQLSELVLSGDSPVNDSILVPGSAVQLGVLEWSVTQSSNGNNQIFEISTTTSGKLPNWNGLTLVLTWDSETTAFTLQLSLHNFEWLTDSNTTTVAFFIGISDVTQPQNLTGSASFNQVSIAQSTISISTNASVTGDAPTTVPAWIWLNGDTTVLQVGNFNGTGSVMTETITFSTTAPPHSGGLGFWDVLLIVLAVFAVIGIIGVLIAFGIAGFLIYRKKRQSMMYDNI